MTRSNGELAHVDRRDRSAWVDWRRTRPSPVPRAGLEPEEEAVARAHWIDGAVSGMEREVNKKWGRRPFPRATDPIPEVVSGHCLTPSWHDLAWPEPDQPALLCIRPKHPGDDHDWTTPSAWCWAPVDGTRCTRPVDHPAGGHRYVPFDYADDCRIAPNGRRR